jgi:outer membrane protein OmpA-like peptidoglycan-associated protein
MCSKFITLYFQDIAYTVLTYHFNNTNLTKYSQKRLAAIGEYLKEDTDLELILLDGYTDRFSGRAINKEISIRRALKIKTYLSSMGISPERIEITGHGERRHISPNSNGSTRAKNRRVVIRMSKP